MVYCTLKLDGKLWRYHNFQKMAANHHALSLRGITLRYRSSRCMCHGLKTAQESELNHGKPHQTITGS